MSRAMIRPAHAREVDAVRALVRAAYGRWVERLGREPGPMRDDYAQRIAAGQAWVMEAEGELVGLVDPQRHDLAPHHTRTWEGVRRFLTQPEVDYAINDPHRVVDTTRPPAEVVDDVLVWFSRLNSRRV